MSRLEIPAGWYNDILTRTIANYIDRGMDLIAAREAASEQMNNAFVCDDLALQAEQQKDRDEEAAGDWTR